MHRPPADKNPPDDFEQTLRLNTAPVLETGHILFLDIIGYSKLRMNQQAAVQTELARLVSSAADVKSARGEKKLIVRPTGDGMALVFLRDMTAPVRCALQIHDALVLQAAQIRKNTELPGIKLRMGIHSGPVLMTEDVNGQQDVAGDGMNMAQRVMDCGDTGHILVSDDVARHLMKLDPWQNYLSDLGMCRVKHGVPLHLFNLYGRLDHDYRGNPGIPGKVLTSQSHETKRVQGTLGERFPLLRRAPLLGVLLLMAGAWFLYPPIPQFVKAQLAALKKPKASAPVSPKKTPTLAASKAKNTPRPAPPRPAPAPRPMVSVPDFVGRTFDEAKRMAKAEGLRAVRSSRSGLNSDVPENVVAKQKPLPDASVEKGSKIYLNVSMGDGPEGVVVSDPDASGESGE